VNSFAALTHTGTREENQDALGWDLDHQLWFVADGMGGHARGQDASRLVKETLLGQIGTMDLAAAVLKAHEVVRDAAAKDGEEQGMGSTVVCAQIKAQVCRVVWVGDSRAYLWRRPSLRRLTRDHSFVEALLQTEDLSETQQRNHPNASVVLQTLGMGTPVPSENSITVRRGDWILLCSDGVAVELRDNEIASILESSNDPQQAAQHLIDEVLKRGARDNTSVIVIQCDGGDARFFERLVGVNPATVGWMAALTGMVLAAVVAIVAWHLRTGR
jgi:serine/threonine protein phosphatase PrpC